MPACGWRTPGLPQHPRRRGTVRISARSWSGRRTWGGSPHPVLALGSGQRVDVDQYVPGRLLGAVGVHRGASPHAAWVLPVLPIVVDVLTAGRHDRNTGIGVEDGPDLLLQVGEPGGVGGVAPDAVAVALTHPVQRGVAGDIFQPQIRIIHRAEISFPLGDGAFNVESTLIAPEIVITT